MTDRAPGQFLGLATTDKWSELQSLMVEMAGAAPYWRTQSTDFWVPFKAFGMVPLTMLFAVTQMPLIKRYHLEPASLEVSEAEAGDVRKG